MVGSAYVVGLYVLGTASDFQGNRLLIVLILLYEPN